MSRIKAEIDDGDQASLVEFSIDEVIAHHQGPAWGELDEEGRMSAIRDYAEFLYARQNGRAGQVQVKLNPASLPR
ncbi:hypothetical protein [Noviherbaspirillum sp. Root189]|uniref:hypothetical protein n=1 Tax=Noviherbaspirillum sp. Root189 TaxID=1736487 RepID=UPI00070F7518|nr:hypothetical protein [Noviherbaspirillum sp. Root189]KRB89925.1 hypothetical protein ASE07_17455 [Noviherbaspirillum sp. Root189]